MTAEPTEELIERWLAAGVVSEQTAADLRAFEAERAAAAAPAVGAASRRRGCGGLPRGGAGGDRRAGDRVRAIRGPERRADRGARDRRRSGCSPRRWFPAEQARRWRRTRSRARVCCCCRSAGPWCCRSWARGANQRLGWLLVSGGAVLLGGLMGLLVGSRLAAVVAAIGLVAMPLALVMSGGDERAVFDDVLGDFGVGRLGVGCGCADGRCGRCRCGQRGTVGPPRLADARNRLLDDIGRVGRAGPGDVDDRRGEGRAGVRLCAAGRRAAGHRSGVVAARPRLAAGGGRRAAGSRMECVGRPHGSRGGAGARGGCPCAERVAVPAARAAHPAPLDAAGVGGGGLVGGDGDGGRVRIRGATAGQRWAARGRSR